MLERIFSYIKKKPTEADLRQKRLDGLGIGTIQVRKEIDAVTNSRHPSNWIKHLPPEITQLNPPLNRPNPDSNGTYRLGNDCEEYALGKIGIMGFLPDWFPEVEIPTRNDIVLYSMKTTYNEIATHVGRYQEDGSVISRWGVEGPVFRHPIHFVPTDYGNIVRFFRISEEQIKEIETVPNSDHV